MNVLISRESRELSNLDARKQFSRNQELYNPCLKEHNLSYKCLDNNNFDQDSCKLYFENYKQCQIFWKTVMVDRRVNNIKPHLPLPEDREKIKAEYLNKRKK